MLFYCSTGGHIKRTTMYVKFLAEEMRHGSGRDFDPTMASIFLDIRDAVEEVHGIGNLNKIKKI